MVSSRRTATNENIQTYGDGTRDFTSLSVWEAATDINLVTAMQSEVLECFDDAAPYDDASGIITGATTDSDYFRIIRTASGHENIWSRTSGVRFEYTGADVAVFSIFENNFHLQDIGVKLTANAAGTGFYPVRILGDSSAIVGSFIYDSTNSGSGSVTGGVLCQAGTGALIVNVLYDNGSDSFGFYFFSGASHQVLNSTVVNSAGMGHSIVTATSVRAVNNISVDTGGDCFDTGFDASSSNNLSDDATAPGSSPVINSTPTFVSATDFHLSLSDTSAVDAGADLSADATFAFDDDIDKETRIVPWDIGGDESEPTVGGGSSSVNRNQWTIGWHQKFTS